VAAGDNTLFVSYSAWESYEALGKVAHKGAVRDFLNAPLQTVRFFKQQLLFYRLTPHLPISGCGCR
jgi:hypothetical protein